MVVGIPFLLLFVCGSLRLALARPWTLWHPPDFAGLQIPEMVGRSVFGYPLHSPSAMLLHAAFWGTVAGVTLLVSALLLGAVIGLLHLPDMPRSRWDSAICRVAGAAPRVALFLTPLYSAELIAAFYLTEVLLNGSITYVGHAMALPIAVSTPVFLIGLWRSGSADRPAARVNGKLLDAAAQPRLFQAIAEALGEPAPERAAVGVTVASPAVLVQGLTQVGDETRDGNLLLLPLPLCRVLSVAELRCLVAGLCAPLAWPSVAGQIQQASRGARSLARRIAATLQDVPLGRFVPGVFPAFGLAMALAETYPDSSAWAVTPNAQVDRAVAARLGTLDLVRAVLKSALCEALWPPFETEVARAWKREGAGSEPPGLIEAFRATLTREAVEAALGELAAPGSPVHDRVAQLGWSSPSDWPALDLDPEDSALSLLEDRDRLDRDLTEAERARFVLTPGRGPVR